MAHCDTCHWWEEVHPSSNPGWGECSVSDFSFRVAGRYSTRRDHGCGEYTDHEPNEAEQDTHDEEEVRMREQWTLEIEREA